MRKTGLLLAFAACVIAMAVGCNTLRRMGGEEKVYAEYYPKNRKMLVIPFKDDAFDYFESPEGRAIADAIHDTLLIRKVTDVRSDRQLPKAVKETHEQMVAAQGEREAWKALAELFGCELVLVGQIEGWDMDSEKDTNVSRGRMVVSAQLYDVKLDSAVVWQKRNMEVSFPEGWEYEFVADMDMTRQKLRNRLTQRCGEKIAECFFDRIESLMK